MYADGFKQALRGGCTGMGTGVIEMGLGWGETSGGRENKLSPCSSLLCLSVCVCHSVYHVHVLCRDE